LITMEDSTEDRPWPDDAAVVGLPLLVLDEAGTTVAASPTV